MVESHGEQFKGQKVSAKLPKLVITKFKGTHIDWLRFWSQFEAEVDAAEIAKVTKFSYLKELLEPKLRTAIDGLPLTMEGYERAKNILKTKYGKPTEIVNAYVQTIMSLPIIHGAQPTKIHEFYEKLVYSVQSLKTLGKVREVNGYTRMTLDKLEGVRGDLVCTDEDWQEWNFPQLIKALQQWTERNPLKPDEKGADRSQQLWPKKGRSFQSRQQDWKQVMHLLSKPRSQINRL